MSTTMTAIYCGGGPIYSGGQPVVDDLRASGFTTVVQWGLQLGDPNDPVHAGDLRLDEPIVSGGRYVGSDLFPGLLADLKRGQTSVNRLLFSILGPFQSIQKLIASQGTGTSSILYQNFKALKENIPAIDGIDLDDEDLNDRGTSGQLCLMLNALGYEVTFCPYAAPGYWAELLKTLNGHIPGLVSAFNLQCYSGGQGNRPEDWIDAIAGAMGWSTAQAAAFLVPGLWCRNNDGGGDPGHCPGAISSQFATWRQSTAIQGGFIWYLDSILSPRNQGLCPGEVTDTAAYAAAVRQGLQG